MNTIFRNNVKEMRLSDMIGVEKNYFVSVRKIKRLEETKAVFFSRDNEPSSCYAPNEPIDRFSVGSNK